MIKAIAFDFGNVICTVDIPAFLSDLSRYTAKSSEEMYDLIFKSNLPEKYESGLISSDEFYKKISEMCDLSISRAQFIEIFKAFFIPIRTNIDLLKKLKKHYTIALLSNTNEWHFEHVIKKSEVFKLFDVVTVSHHVKEIKPGERIYRDLLKKLGLEPQECVFIDDMKPNVDAACAMGINGIQYTTHEELLKALSKLNVAV